MNNDKNNQSGSQINQDVIQGKWRQLKGKVQEKWGNLTDDDLQSAEGSREYLVGKIQERYGRTRAQAEQEVNDFTTSLDQQKL